jgi:protoporphyrinogen oxidase
MSQTPDHTRYLIVGAGMTGLAFANFIDDEDYLVVERDDEIGGWCKTVKQDGFVWDYSGHFFHFRHPEVEAYLRDRMPEHEVVTVAKVSRILHEGSWVDFPFQKNIHQLPKDVFIECLYDLFFRETGHGATAGSFAEMLYEKFGKSISERFLIPYNEKLYACSLDNLDRNAMGRFFPHADLESIVRNMREPDNASYNANFTYPRNGAIMYVNALASEVPDEKLVCGDGVEAVDLSTKVATMESGRQIGFDNLITSAPFDKLMHMTEVEHDDQAFTSNKVLVFNLGFDSKGLEDAHWVYFPDRDVRFYRVGFYDNIMGTDRMSLYVEIGLETDADYDLETERERVLDDLKKTGIVDRQQLVSWHSVVLDPAYVHITERSRAEHQRLCGILNTKGVYPVGRYGGWTYCSIEDNIVEARELAERFNAI